MVPSPDKWGRVVLLIIAVIEGLFGVVKSKGKGLGCLFFVGLFFEAACALIQSTALVLLAFKKHYSQNERVSALMAVGIDGVFLCLEAFYVAKQLLASRNRPLGGSCKSSMIAVVTAPILLALSAPIIIAKIRRSTDPFLSAHNASLLSGLALSPLSSPFVAFIASSLIPSHYELAVGVVALAVYGGIAFNLGLRILRASTENVSISFLIVSNLIPATVTLLSSLALHQSSETCQDEEAQVCK